MSHDPQGTNNEYTVVYYPKSSWDDCLCPEKDSVFINKTAKKFSFSIQVPYQPLQQNTCKLPTEMTLNPLKY